jgi:hypothetical protein
MAIRFKGMIRDGVVDVPHQIIRRLAVLAAVNSRGL